MILVTGAKGHIGNVLVKLLYEKGYTDIRVTVQKACEPYIEQYVKEVVQCDIRSAQDVDKAVCGCSDVFHVAGLISMSSKNKRLLHDINVGGVRHILRACKTHGVSRFVYVSSIHALSPAADMRVDETLNPNPNSRRDAYACSKLAATLEVLGEKELDTVVVYPTGVIGPYDYRGSMSGDMFRKYIGKKGIKLYCDGQYDFVDVRDVAEGIYRAWKLGKKGEGYILSGESCTVKQMIEYISQCTSAPCRMVRVPTALVKCFATVSPAFYALARKNPVVTKETLDVVTSGIKICGDKACSQIGFSPRPLKQTMRDTVEWYTHSLKKGAT